MLSAGIERLNLASAGSLAKAEGATTEVAPIVTTSDKAMQIGTDSLGPTPDAVGLLRNYKPEGKLVLAARVSGKANSAFPDGAPKAAEAKKDEPAPKPGVKEVINKGAAKGAEAKGSDKAGEPAAPAKPGVASGNLNVIVIADTDLLNDQFWVEVRDFLGQQVAIPNAHNSAFVLAALENLSGSDALISLRGRGIIDRPFELVERLRRDFGAALPRQGGSPHRQAEGRAGTAQQAREGRARARAWCCPTPIARPSRSSAPRCW